MSGQRRREVARGDAHVRGAGDRTADDEQVGAVGQRLLGGGDPRLVARRRGGRADAGPASTASTASLRTTSRGESAKPTLASWSAASEVRTVTPATFVVSRASTAARTMSEPPPACTVR